jgi:type I restriction enzyme S subunit
MNIKQGYKQTEIGIIPEDWEVKKIGEVLKVKHGKSQKEVENKSGLYPILGTGGLMSYANQFLYDKPSVLIGRKGTIDKPQYMESPFWTVDTLFYTEIFNNNLPKYLYYKFLQIDWYSYNEASGVPSLNAKTIEKISITIPPLKEQTAIATALSDIDALIGELDKLIAKKQGIKQATMQQLLTGKKRLAGFRGEWEVKRLGELCEKITTGKLDANAMSEEGEYPFFTCAKENYWIDNYAFDSESLLISGNGANVGYVHYYKGKFNAYQRTYVLSGFYVDIQFLKFFLQRNLHDRIRVEVNAGSTPYIVMNTLTEMDIYLPNNQKEQTAIANILSDMDAEISQLEGRRAKMGELKQGMMQELLTGRIRLTGGHYL